MNPKHPVRKLAALLETNPEVTEVKVCGIFRLCLKVTLTNGEALWFGEKGWE